MELRPRLLRIGSGVWSGWPEQVYQRQRFQERLVAVQQHLTKCLDTARAGRLRILSICAGDGRDVIGVLRGHPRRDDVHAWLVELNSESVAAGIQRATTAGLDETVEFIHADATNYATYRRIAPADVILMCGVWGHVPVQERSQLVHGLATLCKPAGTVVWTCGLLKGMARVDDIQARFTAPSWEKIRSGLTPDATWVVATYRYHGPVIAIPTTGRIFNFRRSAAG